MDAPEFCAFWLGSSGSSWASIEAAKPAFHDASIRTTTPALRGKRNTRHVLWVLGTMWISTRMIAVELSYDKTSENEQNGLPGSRRHVKRTLRASSFEADSEKVVSSRFRLDLAYGKSPGSPYDNT